MKIRTLLCGAAVALMLTACGPTKTGMQARGDARGRLDAFGARFTYVQAKQEFENGQFERALNDVERAIAQEPRDVEARVLKGRILLEMNRLESAMETFLAACEMNEAFAEPHYFAGIIYQRWSDDEEAFDHYKKASELEPTSVQYLLAMAESLVALGELEQARVLVNSKLKRFESNAALRHLLGQIAMLEGDAVTASKHYREARLLDSDNLFLLEELTWIQYEAQEYAACYESIQQLRAKLKEARYDLEHLEARCLTMLGRTADAHNAYLKLSRTYKSNPAVWIELGTLAWKLGDYRRVAESSMKTISLAPERFEGYMLKGLYERHQGRLNEAAQLFQQAAMRTDTTVMPRLLLGQTLEQLGKPESAKKAYEAALKVNPSNADAQSMLNALDSKFASVPTSN